MWYCSTWGGEEEKNKKWIRFETLKWACNSAWVMDFNTWQAVTSLGAPWNSGPRDNIYPWIFSLRLSNNEIFKLFLRPSGIFQTFHPLLGANFRVPRCWVHTGDQIRAGYETTVCYLSMNCEYDPKKLESRIRDKNSLSVFHERLKPLMNYRQKHSWTLIRERQGCSAEAVIISKYTLVSSPPCANMQMSGKV